MNFKIGDRVRVIDSTSVNYGVECSVTSSPRFKRRFDIKSGEFIRRDWIYRVDISDGPWSYTESELESIYDGNETVSWESCIWQPSPVVTI